MALRVNFLNDHLQSSELTCGSDEGSEFERFDYIRLPLYVLGY